jgi:two-component sensor histidine kinase
MMARPTLAFSRPDIAAESDHRIANSLSIVASLARMQTSNIGGTDHRIDGHEVRELLQELGERVDTVARLHRLLAESPAERTIDLAKYLPDISGAVVSALSSDHDIELHFACDRNCSLPAESALPIGLIVVELVTNAIKYAHPAGVTGKIRVACSKEADGTITVEVSDDGVGLPEGFDPMMAGSAGLRLVRSWTAQLTARIGFEHNALGLSCVLQVPTGVGA